MLGPIEPEPNANSTLVHSGPCSIISSTSFANDVQYLSISLYIYIVSVWFYPIYRWRIYSIFIITKHEWRKIGTVMMSAIRTARMDYLNCFSLFLVRVDYDRLRYGECLCSCVSVCLLKWGSLCVYGGKVTAITSEIQLKRFDSSWLLLATDRPKPKNNTKRNDKRQTEPNLPPVQLYSFTHQHQTWTK